MTKVNFFFAVMAIATVFVACEKEDIDVSTTNRKNNFTNLVAGSRQTSLNQILAFEKILPSSLFNNDGANSNGAKVRSSTPREIDKVDYLISADGDTLIYCINYKNNQGFVLLSGNNSAFPLLGHSVSGNFNLKGDVNDPSQFWLSEKAEQIQKEIVLPLDTTSEYYQNWKYLGHPDYTYDIEIVPTEELTTSDSPMLRSRRKHSTGKATIHPYTGGRLQWGQQTGYNFNAPVKGQLAGCPAVAIGMLCYDLHRRPTYSGAKPTQYDMSSALDRYTEDKQSVVSLMLRDIADNIPSYSWGFQVSGATEPNIEIGLRRIGFKNADMKAYDFEEAYRNMGRHGILLAGFSNAGGHIWFCDGYYEQAYKVTRKFLWWKVKTWNEYEDRLYMNWGWNGNNNGWFVAHDFGSFGNNKRMVVDLTYSN